MSEQETKLCKYCQTQIPKKAKVCPNCRKKQKGKGGWIAIIIIVIVVIIGIANSGGSDDNSAKVDNSTAKVDNSTVESLNETNDNSEASDSETAEGDGNNVVLPGGSFEARGLKVTVDDAVVDYQVKDNEYGFYTLDDGLIYVATTFTFENTGESDVYVSIYDFDCYADDELCEQQYISDGGDFINTNLSAGRKKSFTTFYAVPADSTDIELEYTSNYWTDKKVIIKVQ